MDICLYTPDVFSLSLEIIAFNLHDLYTVMRSCGADFIALAIKPGAHKLSKICADTG